MPTSLPTQDPNNDSFIYQRFQRGIMHYDAACRCTQGLLLADYFKALLTGENLPVDLAAQASASPFLRQYAPDRPTGLRQPTALPGTDLTAAFLRQAAPSTASTASLGHGRQRLLDGVKLLLERAARRGSGSATASAPRSTRWKRPGSPRRCWRSWTRTPRSRSGRCRRPSTRATAGSAAAAAARSARSSSTPAGSRATRSAIATLIVHEAKHLEDDLAGVDPRAPEACFQFEVRAFTQQALAWQAFYGPSGKAQPRRRARCRAERLAERPPARRRRDREARPPALREGVQPARPAPPLSEGSVQDSGVSRGLIS